MKELYMLINDAYKAYIIEETDHSFMIEKNKCNKNKTIVWNSIIRI